MSAGMTVVQYGDVVFTNCHTKRFAEESVFDESDTDLLYHKFHIRFVGYLTGNSASFAQSVHIDPSPSSGDTAAHHAEVRSRVLKPRQNFSMKLGVPSSGTGGTVVLEAAPVQGGAARGINLDVNNGPKCRMFEVMNIIANNLLEVEAEFEICVVQCDDEGGSGGSQNQNGVLSNRWTVNDDIDQNFYTTRTWNGRLETAGVIKNPNAFRYWVLPPQQPGMQRTEMSFNVTNDGRTLEYTVKDIEVAWSAPDPATYWNVRHTETILHGGTLMVGSIDVTLGGDRLANRKQMFAIAAQIIRGKLVGSKGNANAKARIITSLVFTDEYSNNQKNQIHASATVQHPTKVVEGGKPLQLQIASEQVGKPIDSRIIDGYFNDLSRGTRPGENPEIAGAIPMFGAISVMLQDACDNNHCFKDGNAVQGSIGCPQADLPQASIRVFNSLPDKEPDYISEEHKNAIYTSWQYHSRYETDKFKVQMPIASQIIESDSRRKKTSVVVAMADPLSRRIVRLRGSRLGRWPATPKIADFTDRNGIDYTVLDFVHQPEVPDRSADGQQLFKVDVEILYAMSRPIAVGEIMHVGSNPWENIGLVGFDEDNTGVLV